MTQYLVQEQALYSLMSVKFLKSETDPFFQDTDLLKKPKWGLTLENKLDKFISTVLHQHHHTET